MTVLGIETSCDETAVALFGAGGLLAHHTHTQTDIHQKYGGVVPELASRDHIRKLTPLIGNLLSQAKIAPKQLTGVAYTSGPGLMGAPMIGACIGRTLAFAWNIPAVGIHHLEGHLLAPMLETPHPVFPFAAVLISGGHTLLVEVMQVGCYQVLGESLDDAVGEAFDKTAKLLGMPYPGGPHISAWAEKGDPKRYTFPRPMLDQATLDMSFSGLKTHVSITWERSDKSEQTKYDIARAFQDAVVEVLTVKCERLLRLTGMVRLVVAGGVAANTAIHASLTTMAKSRNADIFFPRKEFCTDNAAMIAYAGWARICAGQMDSLVLKVRARWDLSEVQSPLISE